VVISGLHLVRAHLVVELLRELVLVVHLVALHLVLEVGEVVWAVILKRLVIVDLVLDRRMYLRMVVPLHLLLTVHHLALHMLLQRVLLVVLSMELTLVLALHLLGSVVWMHALRRVKVIAVHHLVTVLLLLEQVSHLLHIVLALTKVHGHLRLLLLLQEIGVVVVA